MFLVKRLKPFLIRGVLAGFLMSLAIPLALAQVTPPAFTLSSTSGSVYAGCGVQTDLQILMHTNNTATDSANIILNYDPALVSIVDEDTGSPSTVEIAEGVTYDNYPSSGNTVDTTNGIIRLTGFNMPDSPYTNNGYAEFGSFSFIADSAGTANFDFEFTLGETTDSNIAENVTSNDILNDVGDGSFTLNADSTDPYLSSISPAASATDVAIGSNVSFRIRDDECGVDSTTLEVTVDGTTYTPSDPEMTISGTASNYLVTINPASDFAYGDTISVTIDGDDDVGNNVTYNYSFDTIADDDPPVVSNRDPDNAATSVSRSDNVEFDLTDAVSGVDWSSVTVDIEGTDYTQASGQWSRSGDTVTINPSSDWAYGQVINVTIDATDNNSNVMTQDVYSFTVIEDNDPPVVSNESPADGDTGVSLTADVVFDLTDAVSGVDWSSVTVGVEGTDYTQSDGEWSRSTNTVTINPSGNWSYGQVVNVTIDATDNNSNTMTQVVYSFTADIDNQPPQIASRTPAASATNQAPSTNVVFNITDDKSGVDLSTLSVVVEGVTYTQGDAEMSISGTSTNYTVTIDPASDFDRGQEVNVTIDADDLEGNSMTQDVYLFDVVENVAPVITSIPDKSVTAGNLLTFIVEATDADGDNITTTMTSAPSGAQLTNISATQWIFTWTPTEDDVGTVNMSFVAEDDGAGNPTDTEAIEITVSTAGGGNSAPSITSINDQTLYQGSIVNLIMHATDADGDTITLAASTSEDSALTETDISNGLANLNIDSSLLTLGVHTITVTATDDEANSSQETFTVNVLDRDVDTTGNSPVLYVPNDQTVYENSATNWIVFATDVDNDTLTMGASVTGGTGLSISSVGNGISLISFASGDVDPGTYTITVTATDDEIPANSDQETFDITVVELPVTESSSCSSSGGGGGGNYGGGGSPRGYDPVQTPLGTDPDDDEEEDEATYPAAPEPEVVYETIYVEAACEPEIIEREVIVPMEIEVPVVEYIPTYITPEIAETLPEVASLAFDDIEPALIHFYPLKEADDVSTLEPILAVIGDDNDIDPKSFAMSVNGEVVEHRLDISNQEIYRIYSLLHVPSVPYVSGEEVHVEIQFIEQLEEGGEVFRTFHGNFTPSEEELYNAPEEPQVDVDIYGLEVFRDSNGTLKLRGRGINVDNVFAHWRARGESETSLKAVPSNAFEVGSPLHYENGKYFVDVVGRHDSGEESKSIRVAFTIKDGEISQDLLEFKAAELISRWANYPWLPWALILFLLIILYLEYRYADERHHREEHEYKEAHPHRHVHHHVRHEKHLDKAHHKHQTHHHH